MKSGDDESFLNGFGLGKMTRRQAAGISYGLFSFRLFCVLATLKWQVAFKLSKVKAATRLALKLSR